MMKQKNERQKYLLGKAGCSKISRAHIAIYGLGGSGSPIALQLAYLGIGKLSLIDPDIVEESNLNRQVLYCKEDVGSLKINAARNRINQIDPEISLKTYLYHDKNNLSKFIDNYDIVIDATDDYRFKVLLDRTCRRNSIPMIHTSAVGLRGTVVTFCDQNNSYETLFDLPSVGRDLAEVSDDEFEQRRKKLIPLLIGDFYPLEVQDMLANDKISWQTLIPAPMIAGGVAVIEIIRLLLHQIPKHPPTNPFQFDYNYNTL